MSSASVPDDGCASPAGLDETESRAALIAQTARFSAAFQRWVEARGVGGRSYPQLRLLRELQCHGPAIMRELAAELGASPRNMTAIVDVLEQAGLVVRRPHPTDRRATIIELSPAGSQVAECELGPRLDAMAGIFAGLTEAERDQFSAVLTKLMRAMGQHC